MKFTMNIRPDSPIFLIVRQSHVPRRDRTGRMPLVMAAPLPICCADMHRLIQLLLDDLVKASFSSGAGKLTISTGQNNCRDLKLSRYEPVLRRASCLHTFSLYCGSLPGTDINTCTLTCKACMLSRARKRHHMRTHMSIVSV